MKQITIRGVTPDLAKALEKEKTRRGTSLNQTLLDLLKLSLGLTKGVQFDNGLSQLAGTWNQAELRSFEKNTSIFDQIDEELWK